MKPREQNVKPLKLLSKLDTFYDPDPSFEVAMGNFFKAQFKIFGAVV